MEIPDCINCGACCAKEPCWVEVSKEDFEYLANPELTTVGDIFPWSMKTKGEQHQCIALHGNIGGYVFCSIYEKRPTICRTVQRGSEICIYMLGWHKIGRGY